MGTGGATVTEEATAVRALVDHGGAVRELAARTLPTLFGAPEVRAAGGDVAYSPAGLWLALAAVASGAAGDTAAELTAAVGVAGPAAGDAVTAVTADLLGTEALAVATGVWTGVPILGGFRAALPGVGVGPLDQATIDAWVRDATLGLIERLPLRIRADDALLLVNALALRARWERPFPASGTRPRPFTDAYGAVTSVPTMSATVPPADVWTVADPAGREVTVVELRCQRTGDGGGSEPARVRFALGAAGAEPAAVLAATLVGPDGRRAVDADRVQVRLPRFALETTVDLNPVLDVLGLRISRSGRADFSRLSPDPLRISGAVQQALVRVAEEGVEAAAVTVVRMARMAVMPSPRELELAFDRPFGVAVLDGSGGVPLILGWQSTAPRGQPLTLP